MTEANSERGLSWSRFFIIACWLASATLITSCSSLVKYKDETIPQPLTPIADADFETLVTQLKLFTELESMRATRISMKFIDAASSERYRGAADATIVLKRPENIRLIIQVLIRSIFGSLFITTNISSFCWGQIGLITVNGAKGYEEKKKRSQLLLMPDPFILPMRF
jgi:hypothetical protein